MSMNNEQLFWLICIVLLNIVAYWVGRHDGKNKGYQTTITLLGAIAPEEMAIIRKKMEQLDPVKFALDYVAKSRMEKDNAENR